MVAISSSAKPPVEKASPLYKIGVHAVICHDNPQPACVHPEKPIMSEVEQAELPQQDCVVDADALKQKSLEFIDANEIPPMEFKV